MLILSRKSQQTVVVGGSANFQHILKVTVVEIKGGKVRLGFDVAADVPVHRLEVWERILRLQPGRQADITPRHAYGFMTP